MPKAIRIGPLSESERADLERRYRETRDANTRTRYQMVLLSAAGQTSAQIAAIVLRSQDTVTRVLKRYLELGTDGIPRRSSPGRPRTVTPAWETELVRVIELDPQAVGVASATWTTDLLASYLHTATGVAVDGETVRVYLHAHDYVCKRPTWSLKRKAEEREDWVGNA